MALVACDSEGAVRPEPAGSSITTVRTPAGAYFNAVWLRSGLVVVEHEPDDSGNSEDSFTPLWKMRPDGSEFGILDVPDQKRCFRTSYENATELPDGRLGFVRACEPENEVDPSEYTFMAYDLVQGRLEALTSLNVAPGPYTWNPSLTRGLFSRSSDICAGIGTLSRRGFEPLDVTISEGGRSWRIDTHLRRPPDEPCDDEGRAQDPAWSPDGSTVAFLASPTSIGVRGRARLREPWNLYLMPPGGTPTAVVEGLRGPTGPVWSPDSKSLAFSAEVPRQGKGAFVFSVMDRRQRLVARGEVSAASWSPDGSQLLALRHLGKPGDWPPRAELVVVELRPPSRTR